MTFDVNTLSTKFEALKERQRALEKEFEKEVKHLIADGFGSFLKAYPDMKYIAWTQFKPKFNDGEECVFGVHELEGYFSITEVDEPIDYDDQYGDNSFEFSYDYSRYIPKEVQELEALVETYHRWQEDPVNAYLEHRARGNIDKARGYVRDSHNNAVRFGHNTDDFETYLENAAKKWRPDSRFDRVEDLEAYITELKGWIEKNPNFEADCKLLNSAFHSIDSNHMKAIFGDHMRVVVFLEGDGVTIRKAEYDHD